MRGAVVMLGLLFLAGWAGVYALLGLLAWATRGDVESRGATTAAVSLLALSLSWLPGVPSGVIWQAGLTLIRGLLWVLMGLGVMHAMGAIATSRTSCLFNGLLLGAVGLTVLAGFLPSFAGAAAVAAWGGVGWLAVRLQNPGNTGWAACGAFLCYLIGMGMRGLQLSGMEPFVLGFSLFLAGAILPLMSLEILSQEQGRHRKALAWQRRLALLLGAFEGMIVVSDAGGQEAAALTTEGTERPRPLEEFFPGPAADEVRVAILKTALSGERQEVFYSKEAGGGMRWYEGHTARLPLPVQGCNVLLVCRDRSDAIRLDREAKAALRKYDRLFHDSPDALFVLDDRGCILDANERAEILFEADRLGLCQQHMNAWMVEVSAADCAEEERHLRRYTHYLAQRRFRRASGSVFPAEWQVTRFRFGERFMRLAAVRDLTSRRRDEQRLEQAERLEAVGRFAGILAHDFNNVLAGIGGCVEQLAQRVSPDSEIGCCLVMMQQAVRRGTALTQQLLGFARRRLGPAVPVEAGDVLQELSDLVGPSLPSSVLLQCRLPSESLWFQSEPTEIRQALLNLVVNAIEAMPQGGRLELSVEAVCVGSETVTRGGGVSFPGEYVVFRVADTGVGMPETVRKRLFEPFFTTKEEGKGTGMGLAMVHGVARGQGGFVEVRSEPGRGTVVTLGFPRLSGISVPGQDKGRTGISGAERC